MATNFPNLLVNAGFETGDLSGWFSSSSACTATTTAPNSGTYCLQGTGWGDIRQTIYCQANTNYTVSIWVKGATTGLNAHFRLLTPPTGGTVIATSSSTSVTTSWTQMTATLNSGSNTQILVNAELTAYSGTSVAVYWDDFAFYPANTVGTTWSPGSNPWTLVFSDDFTNSSHIDQTGSNADGFLWYPQMFYGFGTAPSSFWSVGSSSFSSSELLINNSNDDWSDTLHTARPGAGGNNYLGTVFNGGTGAYFEAKIRFLNTSSIGSSGWPAFWLDDMKREANGIDKSMPGNPGSTEGVELDVMEFNPTWVGGSTKQAVFTIHDWISGMSGGQAGIGNQIYFPAGFDPLQYHTYGLLWMPASSGSNWVGYVQSFLDGNPGPSYCWLGNQTYSGVIPPTQASLLTNGYLGSEIDNDWLMMILGASQGGTPTIGFDYVKVWAATPSSSIKTVFSSTTNLAVNITGNITVTGVIPPPLQTPPVVSLLQVSVTGSISFTGGIEFTGIIGPAPAATAGGFKSVYESTILNAIAKRMGYDPAVNFTINVGAAFLEYINERAREAWESYDWSELVLMELRHFAADWSSLATYMAGQVVWYNPDSAYYQAVIGSVNQIPTSNTTYWTVVAPTTPLQIPTLQPGYKEIGTIFGVFIQDPTVTATPIQVNYTRNSIGIVVFIDNTGTPNIPQIINGVIQYPSTIPTGAYVAYRIAYPGFATDFYNSNLAYNAGQQVYFTNNPLTGDTYTCIQNTTPGIDPTSGNYWTLQPFPYIFSEFVKLAAYADALTEDGQHDKANVEIQKAYKRLQDEMDKQTLQQALVNRFYAITS